MKKFRLLVTGIVCCYIILAIGIFVALDHLQFNQNNRYRVEINRIINIIDQNEDFEHEIYSDAGIPNNEYNNIISLPVEKYIDNLDIHSMKYLSCKATEISELQSFYHAENGYQNEIVPLIRNDQQIGLLRFDYKKNIDLTKGILLSEAALLLMTIIILLFLIYIHINILRPFQTFSEVPYELSKGNLNLTVKESKNKYFGKFLWGIGMLKDTLDLHKGKELKLTKDKKMLLLSVSHDIKTPLNAIALYAKAIEQGIYQTDEDKRNAVIKIQEKVEEINDFVRTIVKSSTEEVITIEVDKNADFYIRKLADKLISGYSEKCSLRHLDFQVADPDNKLIKGDIDRIYEAIGNLIENALKYGDGQRISITFSEEEYCQLIHVFNSGTPVESSEMPHLFESFYRGTNVQGQLGNGLGLYICQEIMKKMNGDIYAYRHEDGMEFVLVCPIA